MIKIPKYEYIMISKSFIFFYAVVFILVMILSNVLRIDFTQTFLKSLALVVVLEGWWILFAQNTVHIWDRFSKRHSVLVHGKKASIEGIIYILIGLLVFFAIASHTSA